jgi:hypothetical protein
MSGIPGSDISSITDIMVISPCLGSRASFVIDILRVMVRLLLKVRVVLRDA